VCVSTGDVVLGDDDGVVVLPAAEAEAVLTEAERREAREERMLGFLAQGLPLAEARRRALE
jgi:4-hydroxy-4-methyl-2-oxoglutarate aldolase